MLANGMDWLLLLLLGSDEFHSDVDLLNRGKVDPLKRKKKEKRMHDDCLSRKD